MSDERTRPAQIEWVGGWMAFDLMGPWPTAGAARRVYVLLLGPLYVSFFPQAFTDGLWT